MAKATLTLSLRLEKLLMEFGWRIKLARQRRRLSTVQFAERIGISRDTLSRLEKGDATIAMGSYMKALYILGLEDDIINVAQDDVLGRKLQDARLPGAKSKRTQTSTASAPLDSGAERVSNRVILQQLLKPKDENS